MERYGQRCHGRNKTLVLILSLFQFFFSLSGFKPFVAITMTDIKEELKHLPPLQLLRSLKDIGINKPLAKFGDSVTNFIFSLAKTMVLGQFDQRKVNKQVLSQALKDAGLKPYARTRSDAHALADTAEAFIGYVYAAHSWSVESMAGILLVPLQEGGYILTDFKQEVAGATAAFTVLLTKIKEFLLPLF